MTLRVRHNIEDWRDLLTDAADAAAERHGEELPDDDLGAIAGKLRDEVLGILDEHDVRAVRAYQQSVGVHHIVQGGTANEREAFDGAVAACLPAAERDVEAALGAWIASGTLN